MEKNTFSLETVRERKPFNEPREMQFPTLKIHLQQRNENASQYR